MTFGFSGHVVTTKCRILRTFVHAVADDDDNDDV